MSKKCFIFLPPKKGDFLCNAYKVFFLAHKIFALECEEKILPLSFVTYKTRNKVKSKFAWISKKQKQKFKKGTQKEAYNFVI